MHLFPSPTQYFLSSFELAPGFNWSFGQRRERLHLIFLGMWLSECLQGILQAAWSLGKHP